MPSETLEEIVEVLFEQKRQASLVQRVLRALTDLPSIKFSLSLLPSDKQAKLRDLVEMVRASADEDFLNVFSSLSL